MVAGDVSNLRRVPGRLVANPNDLEDSYPYGGTELGLVSGVELMPLGTSFRVLSESLGEATDILEGNNHTIFGCFLRGWDDDALEIMFAGGYELGSTTEHAVYFEPGNRHPGQSALSRAVKLLFVPDDRLNSPGVLIYRGVPDWTEGARVVFQRGEELGIQMTVDCLQDTAGRTYRIGRIDDLTL